MKREALLVVLCACAGALIAPLAEATSRFGVAEDATKYAEDGGASLYPKLIALGMDTNRMTVHWDPTDPTTVQEQGFLDRAVPAARKAGVRVILDVYPNDRYAFTTGSPEVRATLFGAYLQTLARRYPQVTDFIVGNEPNERYFWQPQFGAPKRQVSAAAFLQMMTTAYDALKSVDPTLRVIAAGPSNEGNDKTSTSPVRFIAALGDAYRASARSTPFMDAMGFHLPPHQHPSAVEALQLAEHRPVRPRESEAGCLGRVCRHAAADVRPERLEPRGIARSRRGRVRLAGDHRRETRRAVHEEGERDDDHRA